MHFFMCKTGHSKIRRIAGANPYPMSRALLRRWSVSFRGCAQVNIINLVSLLS